MTGLLNNIAYEAPAQPQVIIVLYQPPSPK